MALSARLKNPILIKKLKKYGCFLCGEPNPHIHHIRTRGAGGDDSPTNLIPLCHTHHAAIHQEGVKTFVEKYNLPIDVSGIFPKLDFEWSL